MVSAGLFLFTVHLACAQEVTVAVSEAQPRLIGTPIQVANTISYKVAPGYGVDGHDLLCRTTTAESGGHFFALDLATGELRTHPLNHLEAYPITPASDGMIYVGSTTGQIMRYDPKTDGWSPLAQAFSGRGLYHVRCMTEGKDGWLYVGSCYGDRARCRMSDGAVEMLPPIAEAGSWYVSSCATLPDGRILFGLGHQCRMICYDPTQGRDVGQWAPEDWRSDGFCLNLLAGRDVVYATHFPSGRRGAFDALTGEFLGLAPWPAMASGVTWSKWSHSSGYGSGLDFYLDPETDAIVACDGEKVYRWNPKRPDLPATVALTDFQAPESLALEMRYSVQPEGEYLEWDALRLNVVKERTFPEPPAARGLFGLGVGPDGRLYGGAYQSMRLYRYDPRTSELKDLGNHNPRWSGEIYSMTVREGELITCSYTNGAVVAYDPGRAWECDAQAQVNPRLLGYFGQRVYRPVACCVAEDGRVWGVGPAGWGTTGGGVAFVDPETGQSGSAALPEAPFAVLPIAADRLLVCGSMMRWWDTRANSELGSCAWPAGAAGGAVLLSADPPRVAYCGAKALSVVTIGEPGEATVDRTLEAPIACEDLRPWRDGKLVVGGSEGFATVDPATGVWHHFCKSGLPTRYVWQVLGDQVYYGSGAQLYCVGIPG